MTDLYRVFDSSDQLLYVGITEDLFRRMAEHERASGWFDQAERLVVAWYETRADALKAESSAIEEERPQWNLVGSCRDSAAQPVAATSCRVSAVRQLTPDEIKRLHELSFRRLRRRFKLLWGAEHRYSAAPLNSGGSAS